MAAPPIDDRFRIVYLALHLSALHEAMERGVDVRGYFYWSLMDNYEWTSFIPRFGLVEVDFQTFQRTPKPSAFFYQEVIRENGFSGETVRRYLDALPTLPRPTTMTRHTRPCPSYRLSLTVPMQPVNHDVPTKDQSPLIGVTPLLEP